MLALHVGQLPVFDTNNFAGYMGYVQGKCMDCESSIYMRDVWCDWSICLLGARLALRREE